MRLHATLSPRDAASKSRSSVIDIYILLLHILLFTSRHLCSSFGISLTKLRFIASARMSYFRSVRDHSWVHDSRKSTSPNSQAIPPRRTTRGWVWGLMRGTNEAPKNSHTKYIYALAEGMGRDEDPLQLSGILRMSTSSILLFPLGFLSSLAIYKLARLENHRVYIEALSPSQVRRGKKEYIG